MAKTGKQMEKEIHGIKSELSSLAAKSAPIPQGDAESILRYLTEERERTNKMLAAIASKINKMEREIQESYLEEVPEKAPGKREMPVSALDVKVINFVQSKDMVCAEEVKAAMGYKGKNAACNRLNKLYKQGLLDRFQLGHKVYYKYDAGKATGILIISPPQ